MSSSLLLIVIGYFSIMWLYGLFFAENEQFPQTFFGHTLSSVNRFCLGVFLFPWLQLWKLIKWLARMIKIILKKIAEFIVEVLFETIIMGFFQFIWFLIRGFFMLIFRLFDA